MVAARYKFSPRTVAGIFDRAARSRKNGYTILVLPKDEPGSKVSVSLAKAAGTTAIRRHAVKRVVFAQLGKWVRSPGFLALEAKQPFYLIVLILNWEQARPQLVTQDWKETVEYLLCK